MSEKLEACPSCGQKPIENLKHGKETGHAVCVNRECVLFNKKILYKAWNNRPREQALEAALEKAREALAMARQEITCMEEALKEKQ